MRCGRRSKISFDSDFFCLNCFLIVEKAVSLNRDMRKKE